MDLRTPDRTNSRLHREDAMTPISCISQEAINIKQHRNLQVLYDEAILFNHFVDLPSGDRDCLCDFAHRGEKRCFCSRSRRGRRDRF